MDESRSYERTLKFASETPWALRPEVLAIISELLSMRANGKKLTAEEIRERIGVRDVSRAEPRTAGGVRVLPLQGVIVPKATMFSEISGATSLEQWVKEFRAAVQDPAVKAIVLDVDSPGGATDLVPETGSEIRAARGTKPIVAVANTQAASAAYWIASQADEVVVSPSGQVGSIGVWTTHTDISKMEAALGVKTTLVKAGKHKFELNPWEPLSADARKEMQDLVDHWYEKFVDAVAGGRGVEAQVVRQRFGQGRQVRPEDALAAGMVDRIATIDEVVEDLQGSSSGTGQVAAVALHRSQPDERDIDDPAPVKPGLYVRSYALEDISVRTEAGRVIVDAYAAVYGVAARVTDFYYLQDNPFTDEYGTYDETLVQRVFEKSLRERGTDFAVLFNHGRDIYQIPAQRFTMPIGAPLEVRSDARGLFTSTRYAKTELADEVLELIDAGAIRAMSFSGKIIQSKLSRARARGQVDQIERVEIALREYGPAIFAAYADAKIVGTRAEALARALPIEEREHLAQMLGTPDGAASGTPPREPSTHTDTSTQAGDKPPATRPSADLPTMKARQEQRKATAI